MSGKHSKEKEKTKIFAWTFFVLICLVLALLFLTKCENLYTEQGEKSQEKEINSIYNINNEVTIENEKLVLKSNFEENREKKIIYIFQDNILVEIKVLETYINEEDYKSQKENFNQKTKIEIIENNDSELKIYYKRLNLGTDEGLSYQEIYNKYMGIIGAYEVI